MLSITVTTSGAVAITTANLNSQLTRSRHPRDRSTDASDSDSCTFRARPRPRRAGRRGAQSFGLIFWIVQTHIRLPFLHRHLDSLRRHHQLRLYPLLLLRQCLSNSSKLESFASSTPNFTPISIRASRAPLHVDVFLSTSPPRLPVSALLSGSLTSAPSRTHRSPEAWTA